MGLPAARVGDMHVCPMQTPAVVPIPHVGGPVLPAGAPNVLIGGMPAATVGTMCLCATGPPDVIIKGSFTVMIGGRPAARMTDMTAHGGMVVMGCPNVLIGDIGIAIFPMVFEVIENLAVLPKTFNPTQDANRKLPDTEVARGAPAQIQAACAAAQAGSPFMEKCS